MICHLIKYFSAVSPPFWISRAKPLLTNKHSQIFLSTCLSHSLIHLLIQHTLACTVLLKNAFSPPLTHSFCALSFDFFFILFFYLYVSNDFLLALPAYQPAHFLFLQNIYLFFRSIISSLSPSLLYSSSEEYKFFVVVLSFYVYFFLTSLSHFFLIINFSSILLFSFFFLYFSFFSLSLFFFYRLAYSLFVYVFS